MSNVNPRPAIWVPLVILVGVSTLSWFVPIDMMLAKACYGGDGTWLYGDGNIWRLLYDIGPWPGIAIGVGSLLGFGIGFFSQKWREWRAPFAFMAIASFAGPALVVNFIFKDNFGRPRPRDVVEFEGTRDYLYVFVPSSITGRSFPSGHASIGFYLMTPYFVLLAYRRRLAYGFLIAGILFGTLMGVTRILQGGHFLTDVLWAGGMVYLVDFGLYYAFGLHRWRLSKN